MPRFRHGPDRQALDARKPPGRSWSAWAVPEFRRLLTGQVLSTLGSQMQTVAVAWQLWSMTHDPMVMGGLGLARALPILLLAPFGGLTADASDRRALMLRTQSLMALVALAFLVLTWTGRLTVPILLGLVALHAVAVAFDNPARGALVPSLVPRERLAHALSLSVTGWQLAAVAGPFAGGLLLAGGSGAVLLHGLDALSYGAILLALFGLPAASPLRNTAPPTSAWAAWHEGWTFILRDKLLWTTMLVDFASTFFGASMVLMPAFADQVLHGGSRELGLLMAAPPLGAALAAAILSMAPPLQREGPVFLGMIAAYGAAWIAFGQSRSLPAALACLVVAGAADSVSTVIRAHLRQTRTPDALRGRVTSVGMMFYIGGPQLGEAEAGALASLVGPAKAVSLGGVLILGLAATATWGLPELRRHRAQRTDIRTAPAGSSVVAEGRKA
ncbi:MAG: MFS transporter [Candidatus Sericytochromatia bacterium]|nr:MFS transporter [Candidatus Sericytochromatia bacterium]